MKAPRLGRSTVEVTELGFGGGPMGGPFAPLDDDTAAAALGRAAPRAPESTGLSPCFQGRNPASSLPAVCLASVSVSVQAQAVVVGRWVVQVSHVPAGTRRSRTVRTYETWCAQWGT